MDIMDLGFIIAIKALKEMKTKIGTSVEEYIKTHPLKCETDKTLKKEDIPADTKAAGEAIANRAIGPGITFSVNKSGGLTATYNDGK